MYSVITREFNRGMTYVERQLSKYELYWRVAPNYYRYIRNHDVNKYQSPCDPYKIEWVSPDLIKEITRRKRPLQYHVLGEVRGGDWDKSNNFYFEDSYQRKEYMKYKYPTMKIEDSIFFKSMYDRFVNGCDWTETEFFKIEVERIKKGETAWGNSNSKEDLLCHAESVDLLYEKIKNEGYSCQSDLDTRNTLSEARRNEILVDIGRDGSLLFCDSRHRLCIAKILNINKVPVSFAVRHSSWMEYREEVYKEGIDKSHPDFWEFQSNN